MNCCCEIYKRFVNPADPRVQKSAIIVTNRIFRIKKYRLIVALDRRGDLPRLLKGDAPVKVKYS